MMYPVLQGIDSLAIHNIYGNCDLEVGGTDQTFNMLMGRDVMKFNKIESQAVISFKLLEGTDGSEKMSKSQDNYIGITDAPADMYGKVMSIPDTSLVNYFELCTYTPIEEVIDIANHLEKGKGNPKEVKMRLAREIVAIYHGDAAAKEAEEAFEKTFAKGGIPDDIQTVHAPKNTLLVDVLLECGMVESKSEFRRLEKEGAITILEMGNKISGPDAKIDEAVTLKIGKRRFLKIDLS
jgi:tyrosyl-tRNA synthetase